MKKIFSFALSLGACVALFSSCAMIATPVGPATIYSDVAHVEAVTSNPVGRKVGTAKATNILGIIATGDASVQTAANSAGISKISHVDCKKKSLLGLFSSYTIFVYGE